MEMKKKRRKYMAIIAAVVGIVLFVAVAIPVTTSVIGTLNLAALPGGTTGPTAVIINLITLFVAVGAIVFVVSSVM